MEFSVYSFSPAQRIQSPSEDSICFSNAGFVSKDLLKRIDTSLFQILQPHSDSFHKMLITDDFQRLLPRFPFLIGKKHGFDLSLRGNQAIRLGGILDLVENPKKMLSKLRCIDACFGFQHMYILAYILDFVNTTNWETEVN